MSRIPKPIFYDSRVLKAESVFLNRHSDVIGEFNSVWTLVNNSTYYTFEQYLFKSPIRLSYKSKVSLCLQSNHEILISNNFRETEVLEYLAG